MSYRIDYSSDIRKKERSGIRRELLAFCTMVLVMAGLVWGKKDKPGVFFGQIDSLNRSAACFVEQIQEGESIRNAFRYFCTEVLHEVGMR